MNIPSDLRYTKEHEWAKDRGDGKIVIGITDFAQDALGDITYLELPTVGVDVREGDTCGVVESVKTFSDIYAPLNGTVVEVNENLDGNEGVVNESPYNDGWLFVIEVADSAALDALLDAAAYEAHCDEEGS